MKLAYHGATSMNSDLATDVKASVHAGFKALEIWATKVDDYLKDHSLTELKDLFDTNHLEPASISSIEFIAFRGSEFVEVEDRCRELCSISEALGCRTLVVVPSPTPQIEPTGDTARDLDFPWPKVVDEYIGVLRALADIAQPYGIRLAFEFIGSAWCSVRTPKGAYEIIQKTDRPNVGVNLDACHFYGGGGELNEIDQLDPDRIYAFHLDDMEDLPKEAITDAHRLLPGQGVIPLDDILGRLKKIGYDGLCSVELFREEYWRMDPLELATKAYEAAVTTLSPHFDLKD